jgi:hypothetical protein
MEMEEGGIHHLPEVACVQPFRKQSRIYSRIPT